MISVYFIRINGPKEMKRTIFLKEKILPYTHHILEMKDQTGEYRRGI